MKKLFAYLLFGAAILFNTGAHSYDFVFTSHDPYFYPLVADGLTLPPGTPTAISDIYYTFYSENNLLLVSQTEWFGTGVGSIGQPNSEVPAPYDGQFNYNGVNWDNMKSIAIYMPDFVYDDLYSQYENLVLEINADNMAKQNKEKVAEQLVQTKKEIASAKKTAYTAKSAIAKITNSLHKRVGELAWDFDSENKNAGWTRTTMSNSKSDDISVGINGLEFGYDRIIYGNDELRLYIGGLGYVANGLSGGNSGKSDIKSFGGGLYAMMITKNGWFADAAYRQHFMTIKYDNIFANTINLELGKEFVFGDNPGMQYIMTPQIELTLLDAHTDNAAIADISSRKIFGGIMTGSRWNFESDRKLQIYGKFGYSVESANDARVNINGFSDSRAIGDNAAEFGFGINFRGGDKATSIYLETTYSIGDNYKEIAGTFGGRIRF